MYKLTPELRSELARPLAPVLSTKEAVERAASATYLIAVGDVVNDTFLEAGMRPQLSLRDGQTRRGTHAPTGAAEKAATDADVLTLTAKNPPGTITQALWHAIVQALGTGKPALVQVEGEEDLAVIPALLLGPEGALVAYGQPPVTDAGIHEGGVVILEITPEQRARAQQYLSQMEVVHDGD